MSVVEIDDRGRMTIPKEMGLRGSRAAIIPAGSFLVVVPIVGDPYKLAGGWLDAERNSRVLKEEAERGAAEDASGRARRRRQL